MVGFTNNIEPFLGPSLISFHFTLCIEKGVEVSAPLMNLPADKVHSVLENLIKKK